MSKLVIVESPSKAKTISKILGAGYKVKASNGHVVDLPKNKLGVDTGNDFRPDYMVDKSKEKVVKELKEEFSKASTVYLASDPDREGEAIAFHIANLLGINKGKVRIEFNEITEKAVRKAVENPREIDNNRVNAQQARRILDRLVGYEISPLLWRRLGYSTSAGRVQSVALRLICELEETIKKFIPEKYWTAKGLFEGVEMDLHKIGDAKADKVKDKTLLDALYSLEGESFKLIGNEISKKQSAPSLPFKTSTLQQAASSELGFSPSRTMKIAQTLYSGVDIKGSLVGLITYMRTDSMRVSDDAKMEAKSFIEKNFGQEYHQSRAYKKSANSQEAHEAIRPTSLLRSPKELASHLKAEEYKLYNLIYERFLASQMSDMLYDQLELLVSKDQFTFRALLNKITFDGYTRVGAKSEEYVSSFPELSAAPKLEKLEVKENETKPPARFTEAALVKSLEKEGIGRPSTYATIVETLKLRGYVELKDKKFVPTNLGFAVKDILVENFPNIMNIKFTSEMEGSLDDVEEGKRNWLEILKDFYSDLEKHIDLFKEKAKQEKDKKVETDTKCEECKGKMFLKRGRFGPYLECENGHKRSVAEDMLSYEEEKSGFVSLSKLVKESDKKRKGMETDVLISGAKALLKQGPYGYYLEVEIDGKPVRESLPKGLTIKDEDLNEKVIKLKDRMEKIKSELAEVEAKAEACEKCGSKMVVKQGKWGIFLSCSDYPKCKNIRKYSKKS